MDLILKNIGNAIDVSFAFLMAKNKSIQHHLQTISKKNIAIVFLLPEILKATLPLRFGALEP